MNNKYKALQEIKQFINNNFSGYFISLQLPLPLKSIDKNETERYFKDFLSKFEKHLQGGSEAWIKHPYSFIGFYENGFEQRTYHLHILGSFINPTTHNRVSLEEMYKAAEKANNLFMKHYNQREGIDYDIQLANSMPDVSKYSTKELMFKGFVDSDRITASSILFTYHKKPKKRQTKARLRQKTINRGYERITIKDQLSAKYPIQMVKSSKHQAWTKYKQKEPSELELEQKALISNYNKTRIKAMPV